MAVILELSKKDDFDLSRIIHPVPFCRVYFSILYYVY